MKQYIGFKLNESEYTIPILKVREIIKMPEITRMPQSLPYIEGVTNLRGRIIPVINLKKLVNLENKENDASNVIVVASGNMTFGILVDGITGVINIEESSIESPEKFMSTHMDQIEGVAKLKDRLVVLLDTRKLVPCEDISIFEDVVLDVKKAEGGDKVEVVKKIQTLGGDINIRETYDAKEFFEKRGINSNDPKYIIFDDLIEFMNAISIHDYDSADRAMQNILRKGQSEIFQEVGKITRKMHDSIKNFKETLEPKIKDMVNVDMPSAVDKLQFVISKTEEAANKTMNIVERNLFAMDELAAHIRKIKEPEDSVFYLKTFKNRLEDDLTELITTQSFQDLTGQTIKKVIKLVEEIENELVSLISTFGVKIESEVAASKTKPKEIVSQEGIDDLLRDFGF